MKKLTRILSLLFLLFLFTGCNLKIIYTPNQNTSGDTGDTSNNEEEEIIPDEEYEYIPFQNLEPLKNEDEFDGDYYPSDKLSLMLSYEETYGYKKNSYYSVGSMYYSVEYDTLYVSYKKIGLSYLSSYELYLVERHAIAYFQSDANRSEDRDYLKAVLIYPDDSADCGSTANISGCASYGGKHGTISINSMPNMDTFLNKQIKGMYSYEPKRDTFAHEYGHISTFYYLAYKGDVSYEEYLRLRLGDDFDTVYPEGLPGSYVYTPELYLIQPEEILADDFVELFYYRDSKYEGDNPTYVQKYNDSRNSLSNHPTISYLAPDYVKKPIYNTVKNYYTANFYNITRNKITPLAIFPKTSTNVIEYYDSVSSLNDQTKLKSVNSLFNIKLVAIETVTKDNIEYYRVVLSPLSKIEKIEIDGTTRNSYDKKEVANNMGYVKKNSYMFNTGITVYKVKKGYNGSEWVDLEQSSLWPVTINNQTSSEMNIFVTPFYDFTYVISLGTSANKEYMYDYLNNECSLTQKFLIDTGSLVPVN